MARPAPQSARNRCRPTPDPGPLAQVSNLILPRIGSAMRKTSPCSKPAGARPDRHARHGQLSAGARPIVNPRFGQPPEFPHHCALHFALRDGASRSSGSSAGNKGSEPRRRARRTPARRRTRQDRFPSAAPRTRPTDDSRRAPLPANHSRPRPATGADGEALFRGGRPIPLGLIGAPAPAPRIGRAFSAGRARSAPARGRRGAAPGRYSPCWPTISWIRRWRG